MKALCVASWMLLGACLFMPNANAETAHVSPTRAVVLSGDQEGATSVAIYFDMSGLRSGTGRKVDFAVLEWTVSGTAAGHSDYAAYAINGQWTSTSTRGGLVIDDLASAEWELEPLDYERGIGGLIRLDLTSLARSWVEGTRGNYGVVIRASDRSASTLSSQLSKATLVVNYGFRN